MAIDIKPKKKRKEINIPVTFDILFYFSLILIFFALGSYIFISQWNASLEEELEQKENLLENLSQNSDFEKNREIIESYETNLNNYWRLNRKKNKFGTFFKVIEESVHPLAYFDVIDLDTDDGELRIEGLAYSLEALEQQYKILKEMNVEKEFIGWIRGGQAEEQEDRLLVRGVVPVYDNPIIQNEIGEINADLLGEGEGFKIDYFQKAIPDTYRLDSVRDDFENSLIVNDWYEVVAVEKIKPIERVELTDMSRREGEFEIFFQLMIQINSQVFD